jgi:hypothetical protein
MTKVGSDMNGFTEIRFADGSVQTTEVKEDWDNAIAASYEKTRTMKEQSEQARIDRFCEIVSLIGVDAAETLICAGYKLGV